MTWTAVRAVAVLAGLLCVAAPVHGQNPTAFVYEFSLEVENPGRTYEVDVGDVGQANLVFRDLSRDSAQGIAGLGGGVLNHQVRFTVTATSDNPEGWVPQSISPINSAKGGETYDIPVRVALSPTAKSAFLQLNVTSEATTDGGTYYNTVTLLFFTKGLPGFSVRNLRSFELGPRDYGDAGIILTNAGLLTRSFNAEVIDNPCGMGVTAPPTATLLPQETKTISFTVQAPGGKPYFFTEDCTPTLAVYATDNPTLRLSSSVPTIVNGGYVNPVWVFWAIAIILAVLLLILLLIRRKDRIEEEILGKPQKPWLIPVEALYLRALRQKDERAWYVVRHHLMEEEYRSSLLWYKSYKKATKGSRHKEALVLRQEKSYERWKAKWAKRIAQPIKEADRFEARLQRKLDRKGRKEDRVAARKVRKITKKMAAAHAKQVERALEKWQKQAKKATKKGLEAPERPVLPEPDYPDEPDARTYVLAEHKWSKKAARFRARRVREQGNLEVKFEKADARHLAKLRRKVRRLARKLDDPDFVAEHPLLRLDA